MATVENRSRYCVSVKNCSDKTRRFPFTQLSEAEAYRDSLRGERLKPRVTQEEDQFFVRIRHKGYPTQQMSFDSRTKAEDFCTQIKAERSRNLFRDYTKSHNITFADLMVRFLLKEAPKHKSFQMQAYKIEGWLEDSETHGQLLLEGYRTALRESGKPVRSPKVKMRETCSSLLWIHKRLTEVVTTDIEDFISERLLSVAPATVDRELDIIRSIFTVATRVWGYNLDINPMDAVRRPKYFNERERRISPDEEVRLIEALAQLDHERAVEQRLQALAGQALEGMTFSSNSARKKVLAQERKRLLPLAEQSCRPIPIFETFAQFQLMTAARRSETLTLTWDRVDFAAGTAFLPETKNGRPRKLSLRSALLDLLAELPKTGDRIFPVGLDALSNAWTNACASAGLSDLHIHDCRHEAISRVAETGRFTLIDLQLFSGHRDMRMLMRYAHLCASKLAKKLDECFKDEKTYRVHRGRKLLSRNSAVKLRDVVSAQLETANEAFDSSLDSAEKKDARKQEIVDLPGTSNVIAFPGRRPA